jgi:hypothetical protein
LSIFYEYSIKINIHISFRPGIVVESPKSVVPIAIGSVAGLVTDSPALLRPRLRRARREAAKEN